MAMPQRDNAIEEIKRLDMLLEYAVQHGEDAEDIRRIGRTVSRVELLPRE